MCLYHEGYNCNFHFWWLQQGISSCKFILKVGMEICVGKLVGLINNKIKFIFLMMSILYHVQVKRLAFSNLEIIILWASGLNQNYCGLIKSVAGHSIKCATSLVGMLFRVF